MKISQCIQTSEKPKKALPDFFTLTVPRGLSSHMMLAPKEVADNARGSYPYFLIFLLAWIAYIVRYARAGTTDTAVPMIVPNARMAYDAVWENSTTDMSLRGTFLSIVWTCGVP